MKLASISVRNFRSYTNAQGDQPAHRVLLGRGLNFLIGPNNCGKSNLLRAVSLALQDSGGEGFNIASDVPTQMSWAHPVITLTFSSDRKSTVERTLLAVLEEYERSAGATKTNASNGEIRLRVTYRKRARQTSFLVRGKQGVRGNLELHERALDQFKKCVRFIYLKSGEGLSNFLSGTFRELLHTVRQEHLSDEVAKAQKRRDEFVKELKDTILTPLGEHIQNELNQVMSEVESVSVHPFVPPLEDILAGAEITIKDSADTSLLNKGTGVRGALLVGLLTYLAKHSRRSLVLAVEEPESFLHPRAQQELRESLVTLAKHSRVSLLVTTHSPFFLSRSNSVLITSLSKMPDGRTTIGPQIRGDEPHSGVVNALFGESITPALLDMVQPPNECVKAILCVEGYTDKCYLEAAMRACGQQALLHDLDVRPSHGAHKAAVHAILAKQLVSKEFPVGVLFDSDEMGKSAKDLLTGKFNWNGRHVFIYRKWRPDQSSVPVEAEDMFDQRFLKRFVDSHPASVLAEQMQYKNGTFHYGFTQEGKEAFMKHLDSCLKPEDVGCWPDVVQEIRKSLGIGGKPNSSLPPAPKSSVSGSPPNIGETEVEPAI